MPITSGKRLIDVMTHYGVTSVDDLVKAHPDALYDEVIKPNVDAGIALADRIGERDELLYIAPSVFEAKRFGWTDNEYMAMWYRVIEELAGRIVMSPGWEFSNGGTEELVRGFEMVAGLINPTNGRMEYFPGDSDFDTEYRALKRVQLLTSENEAIGLADAIAILADSILYLRERGFAYDRLFLGTQRLAAINVALMDPAYSKDAFSTDVASRLYGQRDYNINRLSYGELCDRLGVKSSLSFRPPQWHRVDL